MVSETAVGIPPTYIRGPLPLSAPLLSATSDGLPGPAHMHVVVTGASAVLSQACKCNGRLALTHNKLQRMGRQLTSKLWLPAW